VAALAVHMTVPQERRHLCAFSVSERYRGVYPKLIRTRQEEIGRIYGACAEIALIARRGACCE